VTRLPDGQLVVLHGQAEVVETVTEDGRRMQTTIEWRRGGLARTNLPAYCPGVKLHDDDGLAGPLFRPEPLFRDDNVEVAGSGS
jgi:hypothetical protein